jgi:hypothetical protein
LTLFTLMPKDIASPQQPLTCEVVNCLRNPPRTKLRLGAGRNATSNRV